MALSPFVGGSDDFDVTVRRTGDAAHFRLQGDLDMGTVAQFESAVNRVLIDGARRVVLDLRGLDYMGSSGITSLDRLMDYSHVDVEFIAGKPAVQRVLAIGGMTNRPRFVEPPDDGA